MTVREHDLKCGPQHFMALWTRAKRFELRYDDRDYRCNDNLLIREWTAEHGYSGPWLLCAVEHVVTGDPWLQPGYCCLSLTELARGLRWAPAGGASPGPPPAGGASTM